MNMLLIGDKNLRGSVLLSWLWKLACASHWYQSAQGLQQLRVTLGSLCDLWWGCCCTATLHPPCGRPILPLTASPSLPDLLCGPWESQVCAHPLQPSSVLQHVSLVLTQPRTRKQVTRAATKQLVLHHFPGPRHAGCGTVPAHGTWGPGLHTQHFKKSLRNNQSTSTVLSLDLQVGENNGFPYRPYTEMECGPYRLKNLTPESKSY